MTIQFRSKENKIVFLTVRETLRSKVQELTKKSIHKIMNLEAEEKNKAFNKINYLLNSVEMFSYEVEDLFSTVQFKDAIEKTFKDNINFFIALSEVKEDVDIYTINFNILITTHNNSAKYKFNNKEDLKKVFFKTKNTYKDLVECAKKDAFKDHYITYTPKKIKYKIWKDKEPRPEQLNTDEYLNNGKYITEIYSNSKNYISVEANKDGLFLISKNMEDKTKDIKIPITLSLIEKIEKLLNEEVIETQPQAITPEAVKPTAEVKPVVQQQAPKPIQTPVEPVLDEPVIQASPTPPVVVEAEGNVVVDDVEESKDYTEETPDYDEVSEYTEELTEDEQELIDGINESDLPN